MKHRPPVGSPYWQQMHSRRPNLADVFYEAGRIVWERGWWSGPDSEPAADPYDNATCSVSGKVCIATAVVRAASISMQDAALDHLKLTLGLPLVPGSLATWNDDPSRTVEDVFAALRSASSP